jgi:hypothetical protein
LCDLSILLWGFPLRQATEIALKAVSEFVAVEANRATAVRLIFVVLLETDAEMYKERIPKDFRAGEGNDDEEEKSVIEANVCARRITSRASKLSTRRPQLIRRQRKLMIRRSQELNPYLRLHLAGQSRQSELLDFRKRGALAPLRARQPMPHLSALPRYSSQINNRLRSSRVGLTPDEPRSANDWDSDLKQDRQSIGRPMKIGARDCDCDAD